MRRRKPRFWRRSTRKVDVCAWLRVGMVCRKACSIIGGHRARPMGASEPVTFVPVGVLSRTAPRAAPSLALPAAEAAAQAAPGDARAGSIEIALANGARLSVDAFVNEKALSRVLRAMKGAA